MDSNNSDAKERIDKLRACAKLLKEIRGEEHVEYHYQLMPEDRLRKENIRLFRSTTFSSDFDIVHKRVKLFNIIFLQRYDTKI